MITYSQVIPSNPLEIEWHHIRLADIGHSLSMIRRWNGASGQPFSVAEHSLHCQRLAQVMAPALGVRIELLVLLHDAHEAYLGDVVKPIKAQLGPIYGEWARHLDRLVFQVLAVREPTEIERAWVEKIDAQAARIECWTLFPPGLAIDLCGFEPANPELHFHGDHAAEAWQDAVCEAVELTRVLDERADKRTEGTTCCS